MTLYKFVEWRDETGATVGVSPTLTVTVTADKTFTAVYQQVILPRNVTFQSTPIPVQAIIDSTPLASGGTVQVQEGTVITITVPSQVEA